MESTQKILGSNNTQTSIGTVNLWGQAMQPGPVDVLPSKISNILENIASIDFFDSPETRLMPPDIERKNSANTIDTAEANEIYKTYYFWDQISSAIQQDASGTIAKNYQKAAFVLQQRYIGHYKHKFSEFKVDIVDAYHAKANGDIDETIALYNLLNYMYLSCQIGIKP